MKLPIISIPLSLKAAITFLTAAAVNTLSQVIGVDVSEGVRVWISGGIGLAAAAAFKEGIPYVNAWIQRYGVPAKIDAQP